MNLRGFCKLSLPEEVIEETAERKVFRQYAPLGVVVGLIPWNYPLQMAIQKLTPALLTGNAFIWKPSPLGPYCALKVAEIAQQCFPPGVVQVLSGDDSLGPLLTEHPGVNMVGFTGSTQTGKKVMVSCSQNVKRFHLEMGGNDAAVVCADADPVTAGTMIALIAFFNTGQICIAIKRVYVHEAVYDAVLATISGFAQQAKIGLDATSFVGPVSNQAQTDIVNDLFEDTKASGQKIVCGGAKPEMGGHFFAPIVVDNPPDTSRVVVEEHFGPILPIMKWSDEADVIQRVNNTDAGLGASVWSRDLVQAERMARQLQAGNVWINTHGEIDVRFPFQGLKQSGLGVELGLEGLKAYCNAKTLYVGTKCVYEAFLNVS
ncbi:aldehyde dehydrogenase domain-containing protein [Xylariomycetidae sp. FL2044]|nr:aldehyde dehydrogenase domain-containing protein [Xylariomycetidae sp. FL2044]